MPPIAYLAVSLFKRELQGKYLAGHVALIDADPRFAEAYIILGDTLQRHNVADADPREAHERTRRWGDQWFIQGAAALAGLRKPWRLIRHDEMLASDGHEGLCSDLTKFIRTDPAMSTALSSDVDGFLQRADRDPDPAARSASEAYILEELAVDIAFAQRQPFTHIYPGKPLRSYLAMKERWSRVPQNLLGLERCAFMQTKARRGIRIADVV